MNVELRLPGGSVVWPAQRVVRRFVNGPEDRLVAYAAVLGLHVPAERDRPQRWSRLGRIMCRP
ncbi:hypothetical protein ACFYXS_21290 [Streptomyces sp. NPDC002574]|uniref:hypothetical protein n=1 Tax=Streptomyces sp. NPDC002574 TaxID=3364652 RepID=UPI0036C92E54